MKRIQIYLFSIAVAGLFCGCGQTGDGQGTATDTIVQDTIIVAEQLEPEPPFTSPDLKFKRLRGHVKRVEETTKWKWYSEEGIDHITYRFLENGRLIVNKDDELKRNNYGQIVELSNFVEGEDIYITHTYKYDSGGYVKEEAINCDDEDYDMIKYTLDSNGWIVSAFCRKFDFEDITDDIYTASYAYSDLDEYGNWCKLVITRKHEALEAGDKPHSEKIITTREITYWDSRLKSARQVEVVGDRVNLREGPGKKYNVRTRVNNGTVLTSYGPCENNEEWYKVAYKGQTLYINYEFINPK